MNKIETKSVGGLGRYFSIIIGLLLGFAAFWIFWPAAQGGFVYYDDQDYVTSNGRVLEGLTLKGVWWALSTSHANNWHPLTWLSLMLDADLFGTSPFGFHFTNVVLHAVNVSLLFWLLWFLTKARWPSFLVALLFGWHPAHVESVAWVSERKDVLSTCWGLITLLVYASYGRQAEARSKSDAKITAPAGFLTYWLALICYILGLMSKPMLVTWPVVMLILDFWPLERWKPGSIWPSIWPLIREKIPFFGLAGLACVLTFVAQKSGGAVVGMEHLPFSMRAGNALISYWRYLGKLFCPVDLAVFYPYIESWSTGQVILAGACLAGVSVLVFRARRQHPYLLAGWLWYGVTLLPVIGLVQVGGQAMADRYTYIPSVGILIMTIWGASRLAEHFKCGREILLAGGAAVAMVFFPLTRGQIGYWRNSETLFRHALLVTDNNCDSHDSLGAFFFDQGRTEDALKEFRAALLIKPGDPKVHNNLGAVLDKQGQSAEAVVEFQTAIHLNPEYAEARKNLGTAFYKLGQMDAAIREFQEAIRLNSDYSEAHCALGVALDAAGQVDAAIIQYRAALLSNPRYAEAHNNLGVSLAKQGDMGDATPEFREAIRDRPEYPDAHMNLGRACDMAGQTDSAIQEYLEVIRLDPNRAAACNALAYVWATHGQNLNQARDMAARALQLAPQNGFFLGTMGWVLFQQHHPEEGLDYTLKAVANCQPPQAVIFEHLGEIYAALHQYDQAASAWHKSLQITPNPDVEQKLREMAALPGYNLPR